MAERPEVQAVQAEWVSLADAVRITNRHATTLKGWLLASTPLDSRMQPAMSYYSGAEPERFYAGEVRQLAAKRGTGNAYAIRLDALQRVHEAHGGIFWRPDNAQAGQTTPPHVVEELHALRLRVRELEAQVSGLQQQLHYYQSGGRSVLAGSSVPALPPAPAVSSYPAAYVRPPAPRIAQSATPVSDTTGEREVAREVAGATGRLDDLDPLPAGYVSANSIAVQHGLDKNNSSVWRQHRRLQTAMVIGRWRKGDAEVNNALEVPDGLRIFGECCGPSKHWRFCDDPTCVACAGARWARAEKAQRLGSSTEQTDRAPVPVTSAGLHV